ncbi:MAG: helix-turn-helix transcriptional regulator [Acidimicrobiales bacterium]
MATSTADRQAWPVRDAEAIGAWIRDARFHLGMTQEELGKAIGADRQYISELERGKETEHLTRLFAALKVLGITMMLSEGGG